MATIRCRSCGRIYDYNKQDMCPKCGAYNRPPHRERVDPDGTVHFVEGQSIPPRRGKVCYEEKTCYEDQTRRGSREKTAPTESDSTHAQEWKNIKNNASRAANRVRSVNPHRRGRQHPPLSGRLLPGPPQLHLRAGARLVCRTRHRDHRPHRYLPVWLCL